MRFLFLSTETRPLHARTLEERPMGGGTSSIIRLSQALSDLGHEVFVVTSLVNPPQSNPRYLTLKEIRGLGEVDVVIAVRGWSNILFFPIPHKKCFYWTGDTMYNPKTFGMGDKRAVKAIDAFFPKSLWQAKTICDMSGFPIEKTWILANGLHLSNFRGTEERQRKRLIYSEHPCRGIEKFD